MVRLVIRGPSARPFSLSIRNCVFDESIGVKVIF
jgi:hypothetical protein